MKNFFIFCASLCLALPLFAQENMIFTIHAVHVDGDLNAFEEVEGVYMKKVAQSSVDNGDITGWSFAKTLLPDNMNDEGNFNYIFVQSSASLNDFLDPKINWWENADKVLSEEEQKKVDELRQKFSWKKDVRVIYHVETALWNENYDGPLFFQFNFATPKNRNGFIEENKTLWNNFFEKNMEKLNMVSWGVASKVHPLGKDWSSVVTWDGFRSLKDLYQYRIGVEGIQPPQETSKMTEYNPDGFTEMPIYQEIAATKSK